MEGLPERNGLNLLTDLVYSFFNGLLLFIPTYPLFLGLLMIGYIAAYAYDMVVINIWPMALLAIAATSMVVGVVNTLTAKYLWSYRCKNTGKVWITQGLMIIIITQLLYIPLPAAVAAIPTLPSWMQPIFLVLVVADYWILIGIIGRMIAKRYIEPLPHRYRSISKENTASFAGTRAKCPYCYVSHKYPDYDIEDDSTVKCQTCNRSFYIDPIGSLMEKIGEKREVDTRIDL